MDSYYALGATSVPMRKSRLVTAIRFSMCLHYNRFWMGKPATQPKHFHIFSTNSKFSQSFTIYYNFFTTYSFPPFSLYTFPPSEPTEAVKGKGKSIAAISRKKSRFERQIICQSNRLYEFSAILFPPWRGRWRSDTLSSQQKYQKISDWYIQSSNTMVQFKVGSRPYPSCKLYRNT